MAYTIHSNKLEDLLLINLVTDKETQREIKRNVDKDGSVTHGNYKYFLTDDGYAYAVEAA